MTISKKLRSHLVLLAIAAPACIATTEEPSDPVTAKLAGSELAAELGVKTWEVRADGDTARIIGRDANGERRAELVATQDETTPEDLVHVEVVFPEQGRFDVKRQGGVANAPSEGLRRLGAALDADIGREPTIAKPTVGDGYGTTTQAVELYEEGAFDLGWSMFGYSNNKPVGNMCFGQTRAYVTAQTELNFATCSFNSWQSGASNDCRAWVYYQSPAFMLGDRCRWKTYRN